MSKSIKISFIIIGIIFVLVIIVGQVLGNIQRQDEPENHTKYRECANQCIFSSLEESEKDLCINECDIKYLSNEN